MSQVELYEYLTQNPNKWHYSQQLIEKEIIIRNCGPRQMKKLSETYDNIKLKKTKYKNHNPGYWIKLER